MGEHINKDRRFQSDKYPTCPPGKVPLSTKDKSAQDLLWEYAQRRREIDQEFSDDLETCLKVDGFKPDPEFRMIRVSTGTLDAIKEALEAHLADAQKTLGQTCGHQHGMAQALAAMIGADNQALEDLSRAITI